MKAAFLIVSAVSIVAALVWMAACELSDFIDEMKGSD